MSLPCPNGDCGGTLETVIDSRDGEYEGPAARKSFWMVASMIYGGKFRWRLRRCTVCKTDHSTVETVVKFSTR